MLIYFVGYNKCLAWNLVMPDCLPFDASAKRCSLNKGAVVFDPIELLRFFVEDLHLFEKKGEENPPNWPRFDLNSTYALHPLNIAPEVRKEVALKLAIRLNMDIDEIKELNDRSKTNPPKKAEWLKYTEYHWPVYCGNKFFY
jgi:hypothetical protein